MKLGGNVDVQRQPKPGPRRPTVTLYSAPGCPGSEAARAYFREHGVAYVERDISRDGGGARRLWEKFRVFATPCLEVNGRVMVGFDPEQFARWLAGS
mgnify:CR=1 FL=1